MTFHNLPRQIVKLPPPPNWFYEGPFRKPRRTEPIFWARPPCCKVNMKEARRRSLFSSNPWRHHVDTPLGAWGSFLLGRMSIVEPHPSKVPSASIDAPFLHNGVPWLKSAPCPQISRLTQCHKESLHRKACMHKQCRLDQRKSFSSGVLHALQTLAEIFIPTVYSQHIQTGKVILVDFGEYLLLLLLYGNRDRLNKRRIRYI